MNILITGINGFVGKILEELLFISGHDVCGIDINVEAENKKHFSCDLTDFESVNNIFNDHDFDIVYHLAAISRIDFNDPGKLYNINVNGTLNLLRASLQNGSPKLVFISSSQVYGIINNNISADESYPINPVNHYGASKAAGENIVNAFHIENDLPVMILRPFNHTGAGQALNFFVPKLIQSFREKKLEIELGNLNVVRDFLDVRDVVDIYAKCITDFKNGSTYNISSGKGINISEIIDILKELTRHNMNISQGESLLRKNEINWSVGDSSLLRREIGWNPKYEFIDTLQWMLE